MAERNLNGKIIQILYTTEELSQEPLCDIIIDKGIVVYEKCNDGQIKMKIGDGVNNWSHLKYIEKKSEINDELFSSYTTYSSGKIENLINETNTTINNALSESKTYTDTKTSDMATNSVVDNKISSHNISSTAHNDIRDLISGLTTRLNTLADSDDTTLDQLSEVVTYIKSNKSLIDSITTNKVNVSDIINNLTTNATNKPLSAAQGVAIKTLIDDLQDEVDSHTHTVADVTDLTVSATELNYMDGVTSNVQSQLDGAIDAIDEAKISAITTNNEELNIDSLNVSVGGFNWDKLDDLPIELITSSVIALNNKIHILGSEDYQKCHYEFDGSTWTQLEDLPYKFYYSSAVVYNDEIHLLGTLYNNDSYRKKHYKFDNTMSTWVSVSTLPYNFCRGSAVVYNDEIHLLGGALNSTSHYKFDNTTSTWISVSTLPYRFYNGSAVVYNDKIHLLGSDDDDYTRYHYEFDGLTWTRLEDLPYRFYDGSAVVYNDKIHLLASEEFYYEKYHYEFDGFTWTRLEDLPYEFKNGSSVVYNDEIHILGTHQSTYEKCHYKLTVSEDKLISFTIDNDKTIPFVNIDNETPSNSSTYSSNKIENLITESIDNLNVGSFPAITSDGTSLDINSLNIKIGNSTCTQLEDLPYEFTNGSVVIYNNEIHILDITSQTHYKFNNVDSSWVKLEDLPFTSQFHIVVYNDEMYAIVYYNSYTNLYKYNGSSWTWLERMTFYNFINSYAMGSTVIYNNELHLLGGANGVYVKAHYKYNGSTWTQLDNLPYSFYNGSAVVYNNEIHLLGSNHSSYYKCHYKFDGSTWVQLEDLPCEFYNGTAVVYNNEIYLLGNSFPTNTNNKSFYKFDGSTWTQLDDLPYEFNGRTTIVYNDDIHILGGNSTNAKNHYKLIITKDKLLSFTIDNDKTIPFVSIDDETPSTTSTFSSSKVEELLDEKMDANIVLEVNRGGTGYNTIVDTTYSTARYRASSLHSSETTPTTNGVIAWTYE